VVVLVTAVTLDAAEAYPWLGPHTVEDWRNADPPDDGGRLELILGHWHVSPAPGGPHQWATMAVYRALWAAVQAAGRRDLFPVAAVGVEISTAMRTALIPDFLVLNRPPSGTTFPAEAVELAGEVWSPGNSTAERRTKLAGYIEAQVPYVWTVELAAGRPTLTVYRQDKGYAQSGIHRAGEIARIDAAPVPVELHMDDLIVP
jgi:hypothetical protein